jgi:hypothetical protein
VSNKLLVPADAIDKIAFEGPKTPDRGFTIRVSYLKAPLDMGCAFALGKRLKVIESPPYGEGKSYPRMAHEWESLL